jgi:hypothetical protein
VSSEMSSHDRNGHRSGTKTNAALASTEPVETGGSRPSADDGSGTSNPGVDAHASDGRRDSDEGVGALAAGGARKPAAGVRGPGIADDFDPLEALRDRLLRGAESPYGLDGDPAKEDHPALWRLLTQRVGAKGRAKQPATVRIEATPTGFRATLSDLTLSVALSVESEYIEGLWAALERGIRDAKAPWRELRHGERANAVKARNSKNPVDWET